MLYVCVNACVSDEKMTTRKKQGGGGIFASLEEKI